MNVDNSHLTVDQMQSLIDNAVSGTEKSMLQMHLDGCDGCRALHAQLLRIDRALTHQPVAATRPDFTRVVMSSLLPGRQSSVLFKLIEKTAYIFGLMVVLAVMLAAFVVTGVLQKSDFTQTRTVAGALLEKSGDSIGSTVSAFTSFLMEYFPFAYGKGSMSVGFFALAAIALLALVDRIIGRRVLQK
jgi:hypothetical protein